MLQPLNRIKSRLKHTQRSAKKDSEQGFTLIELLVALCLAGILSAIAIPTYFTIVKKAFCMDSSGLCWPEPKKPGSCWVTSMDCFFPRLGRRPGNVYRQPESFKRVDGFYVNLTNPNSSATVYYKAYLCSTGALAIEDKKLIVSSFTDMDYLDNKINYIKFSDSVCGFEFFLINKSRYDGNRIEFVMNFR
ncbi:prepilin-type N-terminal cleavage/methylation domain-containing protein [Trichocoleus sp. DQ-A3]|uniref:type IV pilin protein n=1 Tax=Cyanophyceae TaxID=3028117 RepID=UPI0016842FD9|nr:prepilin-type N-terminal cleavage/methylation domain-containing protein [Coleofasciculus sp. FACHB-125]MBD1902057.1 prepilin-type N-terminal cleavage/methylation domain-containing protein [Coleofasciculus sp. FACHB-125]